MSVSPMHSTCGLAVAVDAVVHILTVPADLGPHLRLLSDEERHRANAFRRAQDRDRFVGARAALRRLLGERLGVEADRVVITTGANGRPCLPGGVPGSLDFNLSHSGSRIAIGLAEGGRIGIDVERHCEDRALRTLAEDVTGPQERVRLRGLVGAAFTKEFYACWTRKEAIVKALGVGLSYPPASIDLPVLPADGIVTLADPSLTPADRVWKLRTQLLDPGYTLSIAVEGLPGSIDVVEGDGAC